LVAGSQHFQLGEDTERLSVALEAISETKPFPSQSIKNTLTQMAERRMAKIMGGRSRLHYDRIKPTKIMKQIMILIVEESHSNRASNRGYLDRVGEPVVYDSAGRHRGHDLRHIRQPGESACEPNPLEVRADLRLAWGVRTVRLRMRPGQPGIHGPHATEPASGLSPSVPK
jgi:hypothetical protein